MFSKSTCAPENCASRVSRSSFRNNPYRFCKFCWKTRETLIPDLQEALNRIKTLKGLLPICAACKKIRDDQGYWSHIESYIRQHSEAEFTHGICPSCAQKLYPKDYAKAGKESGP